TGSASCATCSTPWAICSMSLGVSVSRSMNAASAPSLPAWATSALLAARIFFAPDLMSFAMAARARFFSSAPARASARAAARAASQAVQHEQHAAQHEQHEGRLLAFGAQAFDHPHVAREAVREQGFRGDIRIVACDARHRLVYRLTAQLAFGREKRELLHLLV